MTRPYSIVQPAPDHSDSLPFAVETEHGWAVCVRPSNPNARHWMAIGAQGITFHNIECPTLNQFFSRDDIREAAQDFRFHPRRTVEQHLFKMWD